MLNPVDLVGRTIWSVAGRAPDRRALPEGGAIAFSNDDLAIRFSPTERAGAGLRMSLARPNGAVPQQGGRFLSGPAGCGLCGIEIFTHPHRIKRNGNTYAT
ncbi:MAG: hypothetical protein ACRECW_05020 [Phyllobacterium sp.]